MALVLHERRSPNPLVPLRIFRIRQFSAVNGVTFLVYAPIAVVFFLLVVQLQVVVGWSPIAAGASAVPSRCSRSCCPGAAAHWPSASGRARS